METTIMGCIRYMGLRVEGTITWVFQIHIYIMGFPYKLVQVP